MPDSKPNGGPERHPTNPRLVVCSIDPEEGRSYFDPVRAQEAREEAARERQMLAEFLAAEKRRKSAWLKNLLGLFRRKG